MSSELAQGITLYHDAVIPAKEVVVAIADTGIDTTHPALADFIWVNTAEIPDDGIDNDENGYIDDVHGWDFYHDDASVCHYLPAADGSTYQAHPEDNDTHGTHVAGIIASVLRGGDLHATDAAPVPVKLMPLKIHGGEKSSGSVAHAIKAIKYAVMMNADICNISWGSAAITSSITTLEQTIRESDLLFITAAGNAGSDNDQLPVYPAAFRLSNVLSITFVDSRGRLTPKSNYGATTVDLAAPGTDIYSTAVGADYAYMSGSSMAVPYVSAIAALLYTTAEGLYPATVRELILSTAYPLPGSQTANNTLEELPESASDIIPLIVPGVPDLYRALNSLNCLSTDTAAPVISTSTRYSKDFIYLDVNADDAEGSGIRLIKYAKGSKNLTAFRRGTQGTTLPTNGLRSAKPGNYTLYVADYAGNDTILRVKLSDDTTPPEILYTLHTSPTGQLYQLTADIHDNESNLEAAYLLNGTFTEDAAPPKDAVPLSLIGGHTNLRLQASGLYTLYARDIKGNTSVTVLEIPTTPTNSEVPTIE